MSQRQPSWMEVIAVGHIYTSLCLNFVYLLAQKPNLEKLYIYSNKLFHNFHLSESSFTRPGFRASGLAQRLIYIRGFVRGGYMLCHYVQRIRSVVYQRCDFEFR